MGWESCDDTFRSLTLWDAAPLFLPFSSPAFLLWKGRGLGDGGGLVGGRFAGIVRNICEAVCRWDFGGLNSAILDFLLILFFFRGTDSGTVSDIVHSRVSRSLGSVCMIIRRDRGRV